MANQLKTKFIGNDQVTGDKLLLDNDSALRAKDSSGNAQEILKLNGSDKVIVYRDSGAEEIAYISDVNAGGTALQDHIDNSTDAHDASAISVVPSGNLASVNVQLALEELQGDLDSIDATYVNVSGDTMTNDLLISKDGYTATYSSASISTPDGYGITAGGSIAVSASTGFNISNGSGIQVSQITSTSPGQINLFANTPSVNDAYVFLNSAASSTGLGSYEPNTNQEGLISVSPTSMSLSVDNNASQIVMDSSSMSLLAPEIYIGGSIIKKNSLGDGFIQFGTVPGTAIEIGTNGEKVSIQAPGNDILLNQVVIQNGDEIRANKLSATGLSGSSIEFDTANGHVDIQGSGGEINIETANNIKLNSATINSSGHVLTSKVTDSAISNTSVQLGSSNLTVQAIGQIIMQSQGSAMSVQSDLDMEGHQIVDVSQLTGLSAATVSGNALRYDELGAYSIAAGYGIATLDNAGKIPAEQLPSAIMEYKGTWDASTNTPMLANGSGSNAPEDAGHLYIVSVGGTVNFGAGNISFNAGDSVILSASLIWEKSTTANLVTSVNGAQGVVVLDAEDLSYHQANNSDWTVADDSSIKLTLDEVGSRLTAGETADLTYLLLDGSRPMTGELKADAGLTSTIIDGASVVNSSSLNYYSISCYQDAASTSGNYSTFNASSTAITSYEEDIDENELSSFYYFNGIVKLKQNNSASIPVDPEDVTTKAYVDSQVSGLNISDYLKKDGSVAMTGALDMGSHKISNLSAPAVGSDAANKTYVDGEVSAEATARSNEDLTFLKLNGSRAMTASLDMGTHKIVNVVDPTSAQDAATKKYTDDLEALDLRLDGSRAMTGALDMGTHKISNVVDPTSAQDASTKAYTDAKVSDDVYGSGWNGVTSISPSKNAVYDQLELERARILALENVEPEMHKKILVSGDITNKYIDLPYLAVETKDFHVFVDRLALHQDLSWVSGDTTPNGDDYRLSVVGGVTRISFLNDMVGAGNQKLAVGDTIYVRYKRSL